MTLAELRRYGALLLMGYVALFLLLHTPDPARVGGAGILAAQPAGYLQAAEKLNPIQQLNLRLGARAPVALQLETLAVLAFIFWAYLRATQVVRNELRAAYGLRVILGGVALFSVPLLLLPYILSTDIYNYVMFGRIAAIYGDNPMIMPPSAYPQDPFLKYATIHHLHEPAVYGPVWLLFSHGLTLIVERLGGALWLYVGAYKMAALAFHLVSAVLIWQILGRWKPQQQLAGTLLYAWNPLALIEFAGSGHNDPLMISLILLGIWLALRSGWRLATVALAAAILIKWIPALLLSLYALLL
ncbi:MAG TPA: hypothetical protein VER55_13520, partial [Ardenticatenaceae bacterium]|nr:hypothetical protein [Ardenticatenaceae bacterium]